MTKLNNFCKALILCSGVFALMTTYSHAGSKEEKIKHEISFLAKQLLDISGQDSITVEQAGYMKPFIGFCSDIVPKGVKLTCITPGHSAEKAGLKTGDLMISIDGVGIFELDSRRETNVFHNTIKRMKTGDVLVIKILRNGKEQSVDVTVGAVEQPAYTLTVKKK